MIPEMEICGLSSISNRVYGHLVFTKQQARVGYIALFGSQGYACLSFCFVRMLYCKKLSVLKKKSLLSSMALIISQYIE